MTPVQQSFLFRSGAGAPARRNLVIEAGAGTGKTTAIVAEVLKVLLSNGEQAPERIVLMTFTEKAAGEIADRVHDALEQIERGECPVQYRDSVFGIRDSGETDPESRIPNPEVREACRKQLDRIEGLRSQTIHAFCQSLLRMFPIEAGLDPQFRIIEGFERSLLYSQLYDKWADQETRLADDPRLLRDWESLLAHTGYLFRIRDLVFSLLSRRDLLEEIHDLGSIDEIADDVIDAVSAMKGSGADEPAAIIEYVRRVALPPPSLEAWIEYFAPIAADIRNTDLPGGKAMASVKNALKILRGTGKKGDSIHDALVSHRAAVALTSMTRRFLSFLDREKRLLGVADFDDLLLRTAALLDDPQIAERVRRQFDYIFVDEFQDTDRTQARIIEQLARDHYGAWIEGKTLIVGDPKQSIYGFRRADPETYQQFSNRMTSSGAEHRQLKKQFRSHPDLLAAFNAMFARVFENGASDPNVFRPSYLALESGGQAPPPVRTGEAPVLHARLTFLHAPLDANRERQDCESEVIAEWIRIQGGDLRRYAILLRRLTKLDHYLDTFDRYGIDYVLPPTGAFLDRRAPVEMLAVLRAIAYPFDSGAQLSAARTAYFALTDEEIAEGMLADGAAWQTFLARIDEYRAVAKHLTISGIIDLVIDSTGIDSVYAASTEGRRSLRHLEHLRTIAFTYDEKSGGSIRQFVAEIDRRRSEPDEMEPSLADDESNAVRILSVHAAKGLEFDTVILPDLSFPRGGSDTLQVFAVDEPPSLVLTGSVQSLSAHFRYTAAAAPLKSIGSDREEAELRRLFYVAVTRAKEEVVFVCNPEQRRTGFFAPLANLFPFDDATWPAKPGRSVVPMQIGDAEVRVAFERIPVGEARGKRKRLIDGAMESQLASADIVPLEIAPVVRSIETLTPGEAAIAKASAGNRDAGILLHRVLELWDGNAGLEPLLHAAAIETAAGERAVAAVRQRLETIRRSPSFDRIIRANTVAREMAVRLAGENGAIVEKRIDRLIREDGREIVVDYKSGAPSAERLTRDRDQVAQYCRAIEKMTGRACEGLLWYVDIEADEIMELAQ